ncbi:MAG: hypothetical protein LBV63_04680, partial [Candidatus Methanoplasma sp.]|nr:hypothetical protein [Candidatus Methanoplasma sp.]
IDGNKITLKNVSADSDVEITFEEEPSSSSFPWWIIAVIVIVLILLVLFVWRYKAKDKNVA